MGEGLSAVLGLWLYAVAAIATGVVWYRRHGPFAPPADIPVVLGAVLWPLTLPALWLASWFKPPSDGGGAS